MSTNNMDSTIDFLKLILVAIVLFAIIRYGVIPSMSGAITNLAGFVQLLVIVLIAMLLLEFLEQVLT